MNLKQLVEKLPFNSKSTVYKMVQGRLTEVTTCDINSFTEDTHKYKGRYARNEVTALSGKLSFNNEITYEIFIR